MIYIAGCWCWCWWWWWRRRKELIIVWMHSCDSCWWLVSFYWYSSLSFSLSFHVWQSTPQISLSVVMMMMMMMRTPLFSIFIVYLIEMCIFVRKKKKRMMDWIDNDAYWLSTQVTHICIYIYICMYVYIQWENELTIISFSCDWGFIYIDQDTQESVPFQNQRQENEGRMWPMF